MPCCCFLFSVTSHLPTWLWLRLCLLKGCVWEVRWPWEQGRKGGVTRAGRNLFQDSNRAEVTVGESRMRGAWSASFSCSGPWAWVLSWQAGTFSSSVTVRATWRSGRKRQMRAAQGKEVTTVTSRRDCYLETGLIFLLLLPPSLHRKMGIV